MKKTLFEEMELEKIIFEVEDVIATSDGEKGPTVEDGDGGHTGDGDDDLFNN